MRFSRPALAAFAALFLAARPAVSVSFGIIDAIQGRARELRQEIDARRTPTPAPTAAAPNFSATETATSSRTASPSHSPSPSVTPTFTPYPCHFFGLVADRRLSPFQENPNRDACGNPGVWTYMGGTVLHDPSSYYLAAGFHTVSGVEFWTGNEWQGGNYFPQSAMNPTGAGVDLTGGGLVIPSGHFWMHPGPGHLAVARWRSASSATLRIWGSVGDSPVACGNGVLWSVDHGSTPVAGGTLADMGPAQTFDLNLAVAPGDEIYLIIGSNAGDYHCDNTDVTLHLDELSACTATRTSTETPTGSPTFTPSFTPTPTASETPL